MRTANNTTTTSTSITSGNIIMKVENKDRRCKGENNYNGKKTKMLLLEIDATNEN